MLNATAIPQDAQNLNTTRKLALKRYPDLKARGLLRISRRVRSEIALYRSSGDHLIKAQTLDQGATPSSLHHGHRRHGIGAERKL